MKTAIVYTVLSLVNLLAFAVGTAFLPQEVAIHYDWQGAVDALGSPWVFVALPAATACLSAGIWWAGITQKKKNAEVISIVLSVLGAALAIIGWLFFVLSVQGAEMGETTKFPFAVAIGMPISLFAVVAGNYMPVLKPNHVFGIRTRATLSNEQVWRKTHRLGGYLFFATGIIGAVSAVLFSCLPVKPNLGFVSLIILISLLLISSVALIIYANVLAKKEPMDEEKTEDEEEESL